MLGDPPHREHSDFDEYMESSHNEPSCQWLLCWWDAVLLPRCAQWVATATVRIDLDVQPDVSQSYQTACLLQALKQLPAVTRLSLEWEGVLSDDDWQCHPAPLAVLELTDVLPRLASLHIAHLPLWQDFVASLMQSLALLHLELDDTPVYDEYDDDIGLQVERGLQFNYPRRRPSVEQLSELRADEQRGRRRNRRLRLALCAYWDTEEKRHMAMGGPPYAHHLRDLIDELQPEEAAADASEAEVDEAEDEQEDVTARMDEDKV